MHRRLRTLASILALGVLLTCLLALPALSAAAPIVTGPATFSARTPADGSSVGVVRPPISVKAYDVKGLAGSPYYSIKVDGVLQTATFARTDANNITLSFTPRADMANGSHTVYVSVKNNSGVYSTTTWSFTVSKAPLPSAPAPVPGSTVSVTNPTISVTVGGATTGLSSTVLVDGVAVPATFNPTTGVLSAPTSGLANDASHDVTVTVTNSSGISSALSWSFSVQVYAPMPTPASGCVSCHPGFPESHPMDNCPACHGPDSPVGEGWNVPQYGPHSASYVAQSENSCVACHTSGYSSVPPLHSMTSGTTSHNSAGACSPCHVKSLTTEHYRYGKDCFTCHASANPLVAAAISTGRTDCEACHPGAAAHVAVHQTTVDASCAGAGCHSGSALTSVHTGTCDSCHKSTDPRVVAAIAGHVKSCDACHSTLSHEAQHVTHIAGLPNASGGACGDCHADNLLAEHAKSSSSSAAAACKACHPTPRNSVGALDRGSCVQGSCHNASSTAPMHAEQDADHAHAAANDACFESGCHSGRLDSIHAQATTTSSGGATLTSCAVCHAGGVPSSADCGSCHGFGDPHPPAAHTPTDDPSLACGAQGCHNTTNVLTIHAAVPGGPCAVCHANASHGNMAAGKTTAACSGCHTASGVDYHTNMAVHVTPVAYYESCGHCHHAWGSNPIKGPDVTRHAGGCVTCHNATTDLTGKTTRCDSCHTTQGGTTPPAGYHPTFNTDHTATSTASQDCARCHDSTDVRTLHASAPNACATCHETYACGECHEMHGMSGPGLTAGVECTRCHDAVDSTYHKSFTTKHTYSGMDAACQASGCHTNQLADLHAAYVGAGKKYPQYSDSCALCHLNDNPSRIPANATSACSSCHGATNHAAAHEGPGDGYDTIGATHGDSVDMYCSECHTLNLLPLHANYCGACHASTARAEVKAAIANHTTACTACHAGQHIGNDHSDLYDQGDYSCGPCHGNGCTQCHSAWTPAPNPSTTSDAKPSYVGDAVVNLTASDGVYGSFGIKATYYILDGAPAVAGTQITVPAPASGSVAHTLSFWSTDWSGTTESVHVVLLNLAADSFPPTTTSNVVANKTYAGDMTFTLSATDADSSVAGTWWQLDGTTGTWTPGSSVLVTAPPSGTVGHTLYFYSRDTKGNNEAPKSVAFSVLAGKDLAATGADQTWVVPSGVTTISVTMNAGSGGNSVYVGGTYALGGLGGRVTADIPVTPGTTLTLRVGRAGGTNSPWGSYGTAGWPTGATANYYAGGGGGSTSIWRGSTELAEAGGGGGAGSSATIGAGGAGGSQGTLAGGYRSGTTPPSYGAGGGGGGWNGGVGGTSTYRGGTGGTSYIASGTGALTSGANMGDGSVAIRYAAPGPGPFTLSYTAGTGGTITGASPQTVAKNSNGTAVTAVANSGYHFVNWSDGVATASRTETNVTANMSVTANFAINTYTLTYTAGSGGTLTGTSPQTVNHGANGTAVTAVANTGYHFVSWSDGVATAARTETNVTANKSVTANFAINTYTLSYTAGSGGTITGTSPQTVNHGASGSAVTAVANSGYHFVNWSDGVATATRTETNVTANKSVTANFAVDVNYTITALAGTGGTINPSGAVSVVSGSSRTFTFAPSSGYSISQVLVDGVNQGVPSSYTFNNVTSAHTISVSFVADTGGSAGTMSLAIPGAAWMDASLDSSGPWGSFSIYADGVLIGTKSGDDGSSTWNCPQTNVSSGARIDIVQSVGFSSPGEVYDSNGSPSYTTYLPAGSTRLDAATWSGFPSTYSADGHDGYDWGYPENDYNYVVLGSGTIANIAYHTSGTNYTLTYTSGSGGAITGTSPQTVASGANGTAVTAVANSGYHFVSWSDGVATASRTETNVTANKSVTANFAINTYTLTYTAGSGGTISGTSPQTVNHGAGGSAVTAVANSGYHFVNWSDGVATATRTETNVTANKTVTATFAINTYTLTYTAGSGGTISGTSPQTVSSGANGTAVTAVANTGYHFVSWSDGVATATRTDSNVTANKSVTANFAVNTYTLTYTAGSGGTISGTSPQTVNHNASGSAVTALANSGFHFVSWSDGVATATRTDSNVTANKSVTANFTSDVAAGSIRFVWGDIDSSGGIPGDGSFAYITVRDGQGAVVASVDQDEKGGNWSGIDEFSLAPGTYSWDIHWYDNDTGDDQWPSGSAIVTSGNATVIHY